jgi:CheY-like chemotaxis protein
MKTVLVIDDEFGVVEVLLAALRDEGYRAVAAADGRQGLELLRETRPDLVLLDFMMPRMDGTATAKAMRAAPETRDIPIVMMSGVSEAAVRQRFAGYTAFLRKPFRVRAALELVERLIGRGATANR